MRRPTMYTALAPNANAGPPSAAPEHCNSPYRPQSTGGGVFLGAIQGDPKPYCLPAEDRGRTIPLHQVLHLAVGPSLFTGRHPPCVTFRLVVSPLRGPGRSPVLPFACSVGLLLSAPPPPRTPADGRPQEEPTSAPQGPKRAMVLLSLQTEAATPRDLNCQSQ